MKRSSPSFSQTLRIDLQLSNADCRETEVGAGTEGTQLAIACIVNEDDEF